MVAVLLRFFKDPRNDEIALQHFFFFLTAAQEFFSITFVLHAIFFFRQAFAGNVFQNHPPPRQELNGRPLRSRLTLSRAQSLLSRAISCVWLFNT